MPANFPGRRSISPGSRAGLGAAFLLLILISAVELVDGAEPRYVGLMATVPFLAAVFAPWRTVVVAGGFATVFGTLLVIFGEQDLPAFVNVIGIALATALAAAGAVVRQRQAERIAELRRLATIAQQAVLRPLGPKVGSLANRW
jgi:drug/metabolite transporter (DMT)-like permease